MDAAAVEAGFDKSNARKAADGAISSGGGGGGDDDAIEVALMPFPLHREVDALAYAFDSRLFRLVVDDLATAPMPSQEEPPLAPSPPPPPPLAPPLDPIAAFGDDAVAAVKTLLQLGEPAAEAKEEDDEDDDKAGASAVHRGRHPRRHRRSSTADDDGNLASIAQSLCEIAESLASLRGSATAIAAYVCRAGRVETPPPGDGEGKEDASQPVAKRQRTLAGDQPATATTTAAADVVV
jgi:hypothetical protein